MTLYSVEDSFFTTQEGAEWFAWVRGMSLGDEPEITVIDDDDCLPPDNDFSLLPIEAGFIDGELISIAVAEDPTAFFAGVWGDFDSDDGAFTGEVCLFAHSLITAMDLVFPAIEDEYTNRFGATVEPDLTAVAEAAAAD